MQRATGIRIWLTTAGGDENRLLIDGAVVQDPEDNPRERGSPPRVELQIRPHGPAPE
jgi:hypothetical protein